MKTCLLILCLVGLAPGVRAQSGGNFNLAWSTVDTGGATDVAGGNFTVGATVGQPDARPSVAGGDFTLLGGFWSPFGPDCAATLSIRIVGNQIVVSWPASETSCVLEAATTLSGLSTATPVWDTANGNTYSQPINAPRRFFRLRSR